MTIFELVLALLLGGILLTLLAPRLGVPWPALLALAGAAIAFVPGVPVVVLDPQLALALFVAPVLLDAAFDTSPRDLRENWAPVGGLVLVAVGLTVCAVAAIAHAMVPGLPWAAAVALGAIVAPPDASAATAVLRQMNLPYRVSHILEGESLLNDASSLIIYRVALGALAGGLTAWTAPLLLLTAGGGIVLGIALARLYVVTAHRIPGLAPAVLFQFLGTFGVWLLADAIGVSAVLTVVAYAMTLARYVPERNSARLRRSAYAVWEVAVFAFNVLAFILVGLQLRGVVARLDGHASQYAMVAGTVVLTVIVVRIAWVMGINTFVRWKNRILGVRPSRGVMLPTVQGGIVMSWCGMRGIVTLAAALALPADFPERDLAIFTAFCVVLGTLVLQGMTLRPLLARLAMPPDGRMTDETALARAEAARAGLESLGTDRASLAGSLLAQEYATRLGEASASRPTLEELRRRTLDAERARLHLLRHDGRIGDDAFHLLEEELDWAQAEAPQIGQPGA